MSRRSARAPKKSRKLLLTIQEEAEGNDLAVKRMKAEIKKCHDAVQQWRCTHEAAAEALKRINDENVALRQELARHRAYSPGIDIDLWSPPLDEAEQQRRLMFYAFMQDLYGYAASDTVRQMHDRVQALPITMAAYVDAYRRQYFLKSVKLLCAWRERAEKAEEDLAALRSSMC